MNYDQITGVLRTIIPSALAWVAGKGLIPAESVADIAAALVAILSAIWSVYNNKTGKVIK